MNSNTQAQKGFKTFILTLVVSLIVFSAIYYIINSGTSNTKDENIQATDQQSLESTKPGEPFEAKNASAEATTLGVSTATTVDDEPKDEPESVFGDLANQKAPSPVRGVLSGTDTSTTTPSAGTLQSTVPDTGIAGPTVGLILSSLALGLGIYIVFLGPRKIALSAFEKKVLRGLK